MISVTNQPGAIALTRTPLNASSRPSALVSCTTRGLGGRIADHALATHEAEHRGDIDDGAVLVGREHAARRLLRPEEHRVEIGREHAAPFFLRRVDRAAGWRDAGIVDQDGDGAEGLLGARRRRAAWPRGRAHRPRRRPHVRRPPRSSPAGRRAVRAARHQRDRRAVRRQHLGEARAEPARCAGHERDFAGQIEQHRQRFMACLSSPHPP